ncbi:hypothetical protein [Humibacillus xanthopallidus]|uniref:Uncharacterized protein n=1 Tax=Humibacillus xanthopallidus TaxID=412689 RepID=A0A543I0S7_9MICO|nr:hypothetical protein [Humibacillus xanthopallidus]TQM64161.1 hypothetical protein FBY41_0521 [Humibacillus xanthopallidus]
MGSPIPHEVSDELKRVVERWHQLPLDRALSRMPSVRVLVQSLADRVTASHGAAARQVPDLGPAAVMDQLTVMVHDLFRAQPGADPAPVAEELAGIRRAL